MKGCIMPAISDHLEIFLDENGEPTDGFLQALRVYDVDDRALSPHKSASPNIPDFQFQSCESSFSSNSSIASSYDSEEVDSISEKNRRRTHLSVNQSQHQQHINIPKNEPSRPIKKKKKSYKKKSSIPRRSAPAVASSAELAALGVDPLASEIQAAAAQDTISSLKLRITGQLKTIRNLESQLAATAQALETKNQQLIESRKLLLQHERLRSNSTLCNDKCKTSSGCKSDASTTALIGQLRSDLSDALKRERDEIVKRRRAEERLQYMKQHIERLKQQLAAAESKISEQNMHTSQMDSRVTQLRMRCKELEKRVTDSGVSMELAIDQKDTLKHRAEKAESAAKELRLELSRCEDDLASTRHQLQLSHERERRMNLELDVIRERQIASRLQEKNFATNSGATPVRSLSPPRSPSVDKRVGLTTPKRHSDDRDSSNVISSSLRTPSTITDAVSGRQMSRLERMYERVTASGGAGRRR